MEKLLSLIMVLMMILSLAACGGASSEASNAPEVEAETEVIIPPLLQKVMQAKSRFTEKHTVPTNMKPV